MKPPRAVLTKYFIPIDIAHFELGDGRVPTVRTAESCAYSKAALGKVQSISHAPAHTVILHPPDQRLIDSALVHQVLKQASHRIVRNSGDDGSFEAKTALQPAGNVIFTPAFRDGKRACRGHAVIAGIKTQHDLAQADEAPAVSFLWFDVQWHG